MSLQSKLGRARGLGSAHEGLGHWKMQRLSAIGLIPLVIWFVISIIGNVGADYDAMRAWLGQPGNATLLILLLGTVFFHAQLGIQMVIEDYVHDPLWKPLSLIATKLLAFALGTYAVVSVLFVALGD